MSDEQLRFLLQNIVDKVEGIRSAAIVSAYGLPVQAILEKGDDYKLAAMTATILSVAERMLIELKSGGLDLCFLRCEEGNIVIMEAGDLILVVYLYEDARLDSCFIEMRKLSEQVKELP